MCKKIAFFFKKSLKSAFFSDFWASIRFPVNLKNRTLFLAGYGVITG